MEYELIIGPPAHSAFGEEVMAYTQNAVKAIRVDAANLWGLVGSFFSPQQSYNRAIAKIFNAAGK